MHLTRSAGWILSAALALAPGVGLAQEEAAEAAETAVKRVGTPGTTAEWKQREVAAAAAELAKAVKELRREVRRTPSAGAQAMQDNALLRFTESLRGIETQATIMARDLKAGKTHDETYPLYRRMYVLIRDAQEETRRLALPKPVLEKMEAAAAALDKLDPYYA